MACFGVDDLALTKEILEGAKSVIRFEKARATVYGSWAAREVIRRRVSGGGGGGGGGGGMGGMGLAQKGTLCCLCGPAGW